MSTRLKFKTMKVDSGSAFEGKVGLTQYVLFQVAPDRLVFVKFELASPLNQKLLADLLARTPQSHKHSDQTLECLKEVSGYPRIGFLAGSGVKGEIGGSADGRLINSEGIVEHYDFRIYESPASALAMAKANKGNLLPQHKEKEIWTKGDRYFVFTLETLQPDD